MVDDDYIADYSENSEDFMSLDHLEHDNDC